MSSNVFVPLNREAGWAEARMLRSEGTVLSDVAARGPGGQLDWGAACTPVRNKGLLDFQSGRRSTTDCLWNDMATSKSVVGLAVLWLFHGE